MKQYHRKTLKGESKTAACEARASIRRNYQRRQSNAQHNVRGAENNGQTSRVIREGVEEVAEESAR